MKFISKYKLYLIDLDDTLYFEKDYLYPAYYEISNYINEKYKFNINDIYQFLISEFEINGRKNLFDNLNSKFKIPSIEFNKYLKILRNLKLKNRLILIDKSCCVEGKIIPWHFIG